MDSEHIIALHLPVDSTGLMVKRVLQNKRERINDTLSCLLLFQVCITLRVSLHHSGCKSDQQ